ncbi:hypothetical protein LJJ44_04065 [Pseudomonas sp. B24_DOA]|nr:hypothetical protein LJJ44_04065 [Pseudomonas sp. B24_DOA]WKV91231.1 hypothetical protein LJU32_12080 [Pseudomonas sp. B21_DOA]
MDYSASTSGVNVDIRPGTGLAGVGGDAQGDTLTGIEKVIGTAFNDTFTTEASLLLPTMAALATISITSTVAV